MKFTLHGREYESYQLSNGAILELLEGNTIDNKQREYLTEKVLERFKSDLCPRYGEGTDEVFARFFSDYVNRCPNDFKKAARAMGREHRYLQSEMFKMCLAYIKVLSEHYESGCYDPRNEYAVRTSKEIVDFLDGKPY